MAHIKSVMKGVIRGRTIELETEPGLPDGQLVSVIVDPVHPVNEAKSQALYEAFKQAAGSWADDPEGLEEYLEWNRQQISVPGQLAHV